MKLEMRAWDLDVKVELEDDDTLDQTQVLDTVKNLLNTLVQYEKVNISITQIVDEKQDSDLDRDDDDLEV